MLLNIIDNKMNQTLLIILIICVIAFFTLGGIQNSIYEAFMPNDPAFFINSCKKLIKEKKKVDKLSAKYCTPQDPTIPNRDGINIGWNCENHTSRKVMLDQEQVNWCSRLTPDQVANIEKEIAAQTGLDIQVVEGPDYMITQYTQLDNVDGYQVVQGSIDDKYGLV